MRKIATIATPMITRVVLSPVAPMTATTTPSGMTKLTIDATTSCQVLVVRDPPGRQCRELGAVTTARSIAA